MQRLVEDLLTLSALESEQNLLRWTSVSRSSACCSQLSVGCARALSQGEHAVTLDIGDAATVQGSRDELASAFGNLVSNAIRYTPAGGTITLAWRVDDDGSGVFAVTDSGIGIAHRASAAADRALLSRRPQPLARDRRHGARPRDRQARAAAPPGGAGDRQRAGQGQHVCGAPAGAACPARAGRGGCCRVAYQYRSAERNSALSSSRPTSMGALRITRYCGSAPSASASI